MGHELPAQLMEYRAVTENRRTRYIDTLPALLNPARRTLAYDVQTRRSLRPDGCRRGSEPPEHPIPNRARPGNPETSSCRGRLEGSVSGLLANRVAPARALIRRRVIRRCGSRQAETSIANGGAHLRGKAGRRASDMRAQAKTTISRRSTARAAHALSLQLRSRTPRRRCSSSGIRALRGVRKFLDSCVEVRARERIRADVVRAAALHSRR